MESATLDAPVATPSVLPAFPQSEDFFRTVMEGLNEAVLIINPDGIITYANNMMSKLTGYDPSEMIGKAPTLFRPPGRDAEHSCVGTDKPDEFELEVMRKSGELHWVAVKRKPFCDAAGKLAGYISAVRCIQRAKDLEFENEHLQNEVRANFGSIIGDSPALKRVLAQIATVAPTEANVLIQGESGTGKELVARAIHEMSARKEHPLVRVN